MVVAERRAKIEREGGGAGGAGVGVGGGGRQTYYCSALAQQPSAVSILIGYRVVYTCEARDRWGGMGVMAAAVVIEGGTVGQPHEREN